jgi:hypothetical protein
MVKKWWGYLTAVSMLSLGLALFVPQVALAVEQAPAPSPPQQLSSPSASNDMFMNYSWNVVADQGQLVVAVNYQGKIAQLAPQCAKKEPRYPYQFGGMMRLKDGWLAASLRSMDAAYSSSKSPNLLQDPPAPSANPRGQFDRLLLWKFDQTWQLAAVLTPPNASLGKNKKAITSFADSIALTDAATGRMVVGVVNAAAPQNEPFALVYERRDGNNWVPTATLPNEESGWQQVSGLCLAANKDFVLLGHPTGGVSIFEKLKGVDATGAEWRRRGLFGFGCEQAAFAGNQAISLSNGRLHQLQHSMPAWLESKKSLIYRDQASLTPYEEQLALGDNLLIASDNLRQNIHLYVRDAQNPGAWLQQTTLSRHVNNADGNRDVRAFGRRLALTDRQLLVVERLSAKPVSSQPNKDDDLAVNSTPSAPLIDPFVDQLQVFERNTVDGLWNFKAVLNAKSLAQSQRLAVMTLNPQSCQPEIPRDPTAQIAGDRPVLSVLYVLPTP